MTDYSNMNYDFPHPTNQIHSQSSQMNAINHNLDEIITFLTEGELWHRRSASESRRFFVRGWGRWHDAEAECDSKSLQSLHKLIGDIPTIKHLPTTDSQIIISAQGYKFSETKLREDFINQFTQHHNDWISREKKLITCLNSTAKMANDYDTKLYKALLCLKEEVENEKFRVENMLGRMWLTGWSDIGYVSKVLHDYFEHEYKGGLIDFNVG
jgi:hypothetical protein